VWRNYNNNMGTKPPTARIPVRERERERESERASERGFILGKKKKKKKKKQGVVEQLPGSHRQDSESFLRFRESERTRALARQMHFSPSLDGRERELVSEPGLLPACTRSLSPRRLVLVS
jgi:hypothetical protein